MSIIDRSISLGIPKPVRVAVAFTTPGGGCMVCGNSNGKSIEQLTEEYSGLVVINEKGYEEIIDASGFASFVERYNCFV